MRAAFAALGERAGGLLITCGNRVPHARGLGSSSAAIVGGIVLARALVADGADTPRRRSVLALATAIEGHPDNVAPAIFGGFVICGQTGLEVWAEPSPVAAGVRAVAFVPPHGVSTEVARGLLPATVPHVDAAANSGRAALLVAALGGAPRAAAPGDRGLPAPGVPPAGDARVARARRPAPRRRACRGRLRCRPHGPGADHRTDLDPLTAYCPAGWDCLALEVATSGVSVTR